MLTPAEENALRIYIAKIEKQLELFKKLSSTSGFYKEYYKMLATAKSNKAAFDDLNEMYFELFGKYRFSDWNSFKKMTNYYNNKQR
ncbi:hypothetical protein [Flavobacterium sp. FlaQc-28]|uniref:hypothetical protein n=1 Tax=Flavobacterium sp. FlaQc-28 TaxID=3374178 RepID=UPI00375692FF